MKIQLKNVLLLFIIFPFYVFTQNGEYIKSIQEERNTKNIDFRYNTDSPLKDEDRKNFLGLNYFPIDESYQIEAQFILLDEPESIVMKTSGTRTPEYLRFAKVVFELQAKSYELTVYRNTKYMDESKYKNNIFIPFRDQNAGELTYGGGRYLDNKIPEGNTIILDFNTAYNPYCAYNEKYSCVIPPPENFIDVKINAGEKVFVEH